MLILLDGGCVLFLFLFLCISIGITTACMSVIILFGFCVLGNMFSFRVSMQDM